MKVVVFDRAAQGKKFIAQDLFETFRRGVTQGSRRPVILPTGSTYEGEEGIYAQFAGLVRGAGLDLTGYPICNMDAYLRRTAGGSLDLLDPEDPIGYQCFMQKELFKRLGIVPSNHRFPVPNAGALHAEGILCGVYTAFIESCGGALKAYGGIGAPVPHVAFNGEGATLELTARVVCLSRAERQTNADIYGLPLDRIPEFAATVGMAELAAAGSVLLAAFGPRKAGVVQRCVEEAPSPDCPAGLLLQSHADATLVIDEEAASALAPSTRVERR